MSHTLGGFLSLLIFLDKIGWHFEYVQRHHRDREHSCIVSHSHGPLRYCGWQDVERQVCQVFALKSTSFDHHIHCYWSGIHSLLGKQQIVLWCRNQCPVDLGTLKLGSPGKGCALCFLLVTMTPQESNRRSIWNHYHFRHLWLDSRSSLWIWVDFRSSIEHLFIMIDHLLWLLLDFLLRLSARLPRLYYSSLGAISARMRARYSWIEIWPGAYAQAAAQATKSTNGYAYSGSYPIPNIIKSSSIITLSNESVNWQCS